MQNLTELWSIIKKNMKEFFLGSLKKFNFIQAPYLHLNFTVILLFIVTNIVKLLLPPPLYSNFLYS